MNIELLSWTATAPGATGAAATPVTGDSLQIKNNLGAVSPSLISIWGVQQASGFQQIVFQRGHDTTRNFRYNVAAAEVDPRLTLGTALRPNAQETLSVTIAGSAVAGDVEMGCAIVHYPNLQGIDMRGISFGEMQRRYLRLTTLSMTITGAAAGYTGSELITAESDLLHATTDYAVLGATTNTACGAVWMNGPDFGNVKIGVPGDAGDNDFTQGFFATLSRAFGEPIIPVFNSGNKNSMNVGILQDENNVSPLVTWYLAELGPKR
jgi:hypothetical protein